MGGNTPFGDYDPTVTKTALRDPGTLLSLLGMMMPNITHGMPGQPGSTVLKPGKLFEIAGTTYADTKNRQEFLGAVKDAANQAQQGIEGLNPQEVMPRSKTGGEGGGWQAPLSDVERAKRLASFTPPSIGQFISQAGPDRLRGIFSMMRGSNQLSDVLGLPSGQTPFERVFGEIQKGAITDVDRQREQMRAKITGQLSKDPFNPELRSAQLALALPHEQTILGKQQQEMDQQRAYLMNRDIHGPRALSDLEATSSVGAGLGPQKAKQLDELSVLWKQGQNQIKVIDDPTSKLDAFTKETLKSVIRTTGRPIPDLEKELLNEGRNAERARIMSGSAILQALYNRPSPLTEKEMKELLNTPEIKNRPWLVSEITNIMRAKQEVWDQHQIERERIGVMTKNNELIRQGQLAERYSAEQVRWTAQKENALKQLQTLPAEPGMQFKKKDDGTLESPAEYYMRQEKEKNPIYLRNLETIRQADEKMRRDDIQHYLLTNPSQLVYLDSVGIPSKIMSIIGDQTISPERKLAYLKKIEEDIPAMRAEYGHKIKGWEETVVPAIMSAVNDARQTLVKAGTVQPAPSDVTPPPRIKPFEERIQTGTTVPAALGTLLKPTPGDTDIEYQPSGP